MVLLDEGTNSSPVNKIKKKQLKNNVNVSELSIIMGVISYCVATQTGLT